MKERSFNSYFAQDFDNPDNFLLIKDVSPTSTAEAEALYADESYTEKESAFLYDYFINTNVPSAYTRAFHYTKHYELDFLAFWEKFNEIYEEH